MRDVVRHLSARGFLPLVKSISRDKASLLPHELAEHRLLGCRLALRVDRLNLAFRIFGPVWYEAPAHRNEIWSAELVAQDLRAQTRGNVPVRADVTHVLLQIVPVVQAGCSGVGSE